MPSTLDKLLLVLIVAGPLLLLGGAVYLIVRRAGGGLGQRLDAVFGSERRFVLLALVAGSVQLFLFAKYLSDNGWAWQTVLSGLAGLLWVALAVLRMRARPRRGRH